VAVDLFVGAREGIDNAVTIRQVTPDVTTDAGIRN